MDSDLQYSNPNPNLVNHQMVRKRKDEALLLGIVQPLGEDEETELRKELGHFEKVIPSNIIFMLGNSK